MFFYGPTIITLKFIVGYLLRSSSVLNRDFGIKYLFINIFNLVFKILFVWINSNNLLPNSLHTTLITTLLLLLNLAYLNQQVQLLICLRHFSTSYFRLAKSCFYVRFCCIIRQIQFDSYILLLPWLSGFG